MTEEQKTEEKKEEHKKEKSRFNIRGSNRKESIENVSFLIIVIAAAMVSVGIGIGSFIQGTIFLSVFGSFFVMIGIVFYIASQFMGE
jgi:F0F1-type ATP synthase assembly protein I